MRSSTPHSDPETLSGVLVYAPATAFPVVTRGDCESGFAPVAPIGRVIEGVSSVGVTPLQGGTVQIPRTDTRAMIGTVECETGLLAGSVGSRSSS